MAITEVARRNHDPLFPRRTSTLAETDPELVEIFDNWAFEDALRDETLDVRTRLMVQLAALIASPALGEYRVMLGAALEVGVTPVEVKEIVYQAVPYVGMGKVFDFLHAANEVLRGRGVELPLPPQSTTTRETRRAKGLEVQPADAQRAPRHRRGDHVVTRSASSRRPYVICHMVPSVDGRIVTAGWPSPPNLHAEYERTAAQLEGDAWIIGRVSMAPYAGRASLPRVAGGRGPRTDFISRTDTRSYAIAIDPSGKLRWESGAIDEDHVITVLTERVSDRYLASLREKGVSYLFGGRDRVDVPAVLRKLRSRLGIRRLLLEGGGKINGSFLAAGCIDELSLLVAPVADGRVGTPTLFDAPDGSSAVRLRLVSARRRPGGMLWLRYRVRQARTRAA